MTNKKIKNYIDVLFSDVPRTQKSIELKEELMANMSERFEDYIQEGKSENQAYSLAVANMGDIDSLISDVMPTEGLKKEANYYRKRNATMTAIAIMLYIIGPAILVLLSAVDDEPILGVFILLILVAVATGILIYTKMSTPTECKHLDEYEKRDLELSKTPSGRVLKEVESIVWSITTLLFLLAGFILGAWHIAWIIFPITGLLLEIAKTVIRLRGSDE